jgi:alanyl-tRNA synthetase
MKAPNQQHLHYVTCQFGTLAIGDSVTIIRHEMRRYAIRQHHSAVHLLQASLKRHLGDHILQQGSYVGDRYARFDFVHHEKISEETLRLIEQDVNTMIQEAHPCTIERLPIEEAKKTGATAPFDEKYGDVVRIVTLGPRSKEFCGGTHVRNTSEIGVFAILFEESIAAGTRRIQVVSGLSAYQYLKQKELLLAQIQDKLRAGSPSEIMDRLKASMAEKETLKATNASLQNAYIHSFAKTMTLTLSPFPHLVFNVGSLSRSMLAALIDELKATYPQSLLILMSEEHGLFPLAVFVSSSLQSKTRHAGQLVKALAQAMGGSGGGRPDLAFGSGKQRIDMTQWVKTQSIWTI